MQAQTFLRLVSLFSCKQANLPPPQSPLQSCIHSLLSGDDPHTILPPYMLQTHQCRLPPFDDYLITPYSDISTIHTFESTQRAFLLTGKAVSVLKVPSQNKDPLLHEIIQAISLLYFRLFHSDNLPQVSCLQDFLLQYDEFGALKDHRAVYSGQEIHSPFATLSPCVVLVVRCKSKPQPIHSFLRSSLLHAYSECSVMSKLISRQTFYKNSQLRGVYFIEEGEVEVESKRIVARGWVTSGKCRSAGYGWVFKPIPFLKVMCTHAGVWKQFLNDLTLNSEHPPKLTNILNIDGIEDTAQVYRGKRFKLPKLAHQVSSEKIMELDKMRHYDGKITSMCQYKKEFIKKRKLDKRNMFQLRTSQEIQSSNKRYSVNGRYQQKKMSVNKRDSSSQYILIMSVLKRLEMQTETTHPKPQKKKNIFITPMIIHQNNKRNKKKQPSFLLDDQRK